MAVLRCRGWGFTPMLNLSAARLKVEELVVRAPGMITDTSKAQENCLLDGDGRRRSIVLKTGEVENRKA